MIIRQEKQEPLDPPTVSDARIVGDVVLERSVQVIVGALAVPFAREDEDWVAGPMVTASRGTEIDEGYLSAARRVALEVMRSEVFRRTGQGEPPNARCQECGRIVAASKLDTLLTEGWTTSTIECGPYHRVWLEKGARLEFLVVQADGSTQWAPTPPKPIHERQTP